MVAGQLNLAKPGIRYGIRGVLRFSTSISIWVPGRVEPYRIVHNIAHLPHTIPSKFPFESHVSRHGISIAEVHVSASHHHGIAEIFCDWAQIERIIWGHILRFPPGGSTLPALSVAAGSRNRLQRKRKVRIGQADSDGCIAEGLLICSLC